MISWIVIYSPKGAGPLYLDTIRTHVGTTLNAQDPTM